ncbi:MAG TPA: zinc ABC transporter substrate-binding protein [Candidatus Dormibacteraeota bacterium]|jgi:zinc/manganese transport system substrate-binding protein
MVTEAHRRRRDHRGVVVGVIALLALTMSACGSAASSTSTGSQPSGRHLNVVAGENFWGSVATQLGGSQVTVKSVVTDPNADPHDYQSDPATARAFANADYVILNGAGYDSWADKLLSANPNSRRKVFTVAGLLGKKEGDNPHFWYSPDYVVRVADRISADLRSIDSADSDHYAAQRSAFTAALGPYLNRIAAIRARFTGQKVAATETIFEYMAAATSLVLVSPPEFMKAVAEGNDPPADSVAAFQQAITTKQATALVYNVQTSTDVTSTIKQMAVQQGIPVVAVSETLQPPDATFQEWQLGQLNALYNALNAKALAR